nr:hypothetical protein [Tanacetum cinerariifolium]
QERVLGILDVNDEELAGVEEVLKVVTDAKLITKVVTTAGVDVNAASVQDTPITAVEASKVIVEVPKPRKRRGMSYDEIRPLFEKHYNYNQAFLNEVNERIKVPEKEVRQEKDVKVEISKREDDDDDVYADATPLASKVPIVDYKIHTERNKPYFKIIRADGNHRLFMSFSTMMNNFDREDLESLWKTLREIFKKAEPKNYIDDYLLNILKIIFEKPNVEANVWKDQKGKYGLAKMYPLTHVTLEQMVNDVRLEVNYESEMSLELLRLVKR